MRNGTTLIVLSMLHLAGCFFPVYCCRETSPQYIGTSVEQLSEGLQVRERG